MTRSAKVLLVLYLAPVSFWASGVHAEDAVSGNVVSSLTIMESCVIHEESLAGSAAMMKFGTPKAVAGGESESDGETGGPDGAVAELECAPDVGAVSVSLDRGDHPGAGYGAGIAGRAMQNSTAGSIPYEIYQDAVHRSTFPKSGSTGLPVPSDGKSVELPIFGEVNSGTTTAPPSGSYSDSLRVMLSW